MNINEFRNLSREEQFAEAGRIAGVEPSVFDGIWRTESGRGANMLSPAGAEGHFGLMPKTRTVWEGRFGAKVDPYDFGDSLFTSAHTLKENLGRFKKLPDALRAYNGGWDPKSWGNPETAAYAGKVLGTDDEPAAVEGSTEEALAAGPVVPVRGSAAADLWNRPAGAIERPVAPPSAPSKVAEGVRLLNAMSQKPLGPNTFDMVEKEAKSMMAGQDKVQAEKDATTFLDAARAASNGLLLNQAAALIFRDPEPIDRNFTVPEEALKGKTESEQKQLRAAGSQQELNRILFEQQDSKDQNEIVFRRGALFGMGATLLADLPAAALTGGVTTLGLKSVGFGSLALAAQGRKAAALGSLAIEGIAGNVLYTAALDAMDQHQGAEQYAMAVAGGLLTPLLGGRAVGRYADRADMALTALRMAETAKAKQAALAEQAIKNIGHTAGAEELAKEMARIEAEGIRADLSSHKAAVPDSRRFNVGEEADLADQGLPPGNTTGKTVGGAESGVGTASKTEGAPELHPSENAPETYSSFAEAASKLGSKVTDTVEFDANTNALRREMLSDPTNPYHAQAKAVWDSQTGGITYEQVVRGKAVHTENVGLRQAMDLDPELARNVRTVQALAEEYMPNAKFVWSDAQTGSPKGTGAAWWGVDRIHTISLNLDQKGEAMAHLTHELGHAVFQQHAPKMSPRTKQMLQADWLDFVNRVKAGDVTAWDKRFSVANPFSPRNSGAKWDPVSEYALRMHEFMAEQFVTHVQARIAKGDYGQLPAEAQSTLIGALRKVFKLFTELFTKGLLRADGAEAFYSEVLRTSRMKTAKDAERVAARAAGQPVPALETHASGPSTVGSDVLAIQNDPISRKYGLDMLPMGTPAERATAKQIVALYKRADAWAAENPLDEKRLNKILSRFDSFDPTSNQMLRSANPVVRMVASELLENGGGAAGRRSSAAIAKYMNERAIIGNVINDLDDNFKLWFKGQGGDRAKEFLTGRKRAEFNRLVAEEIEQRRYGTQQTDLGDAVRGAADSVEASFERARLMQVDAKTVGWAALPETSRGYMPHRMKPETVRSLTNGQKRAVHSVLTDQFVGISGFDMSFADQLASRYLETIERRALGGFSAPVGLHQTGASDVVKEALEQMGLTKPEIEAKMKQYAQGGAGHTKKRLNLDLRQSYTDEDGGTFRLLDLFDTDMLSLVRGQSQRVSGEVALARHGVMGKPGLAILREAMMKGGVEHAAKRNELDAFDATAAEFLGAPFGTQNKWVDRAMQANSVASLGGMGFNQLGELINVGTTLGVKAAFSNIASFGRLRAEIKALARGQKVSNPLLGSIEQFGGAQFGTDAYKMVFPMDLPDAPMNTMGADTLHYSDKLLRGAGHLQTKLSGWRAISSVQQRGVAEQVVHNIARILREGKTDVTMADMGLSQELVDRLRADLPNIAKFQGNKLVEFDITKATDLDAANQLVQSVHRGVNQMIQGTFIGETGKYVHNSYLKMLAQFRGFSLTAVDKQWNRQAANYGVGRALFTMVGAMSAAAPIYMVRTYLASIGREDQEEYLDRHLSFGSVARATTNYIATSGLAGDFLDAFTAVTGTGEMTGGRSGANTQLVGNLAAPVLGKVDKVWGALQNTKDGTDVHGLLKEAPLSRLPFFIPAVNALGD